MAEPFTFQPQIMDLLTTKLELNLARSQWEAVQNVVCRQVRIYEAQLEGELDVEAYHGIDFYRKALCNLSNEIARALKGAESFKVK